MNTAFFYLFAALLFICPAKTTSNSDSYKELDGISILKTDDVTMSYKEFKNANNNVYRTRYSITNNTGTAKRVTWSFTGYKNCTSSGGFSGIESLIGYGYVDITTFTQIDESKEWTEGSYTIKWE